MMIYATSYRRSQAVKHADKSNEQIKREVLSVDACLYEAIDGCGGFCLPPAMIIDDIIRHHFPRYNSTRIFGKALLDALDG